MTTRLKDICPFKIGVAVNTQQIIQNRELILREFNSVTCDNAMKLNYRIKPDGSYDFTEADALYSFAVSNGLEIRGHVIAWHIGFPESRFGKMTREELLDEIRRYIVAVANRYPLIYAWDIVNEGIDGESESLLKKTPFHRIIGEDYLEQIFKIARKEFGSKVALYLNEDDEWRLKKPVRIPAFAKALLEKGTPLDGIGLQCHISPYEDLSGYRTLFDSIRRLGLKCQITEMEVSVYDFDKGYYTVCPPEAFALQAETYMRMFEMFFEYSDIIDLVSFWTVSDRETWRDHWPVENRKDWPSLFNEKNQPKPIYQALCDKFGAYAAYSCS